MFLLNPWCCAAETLSCVPSSPPRIKIPRRSYGAGEGAATMECGASAIRLQPPPTSYRYASRKYRRCTLPSAPATSSAPPKTQNDFSLPAATGSIRPLPGNESAFVHFGSAADKSRRQTEFKACVESGFSIPPAMNRELPTTAPHAFAIGRGRDGNAVVVTTAVFPLESKRICVVADLVASTNANNAVVENCAYTVPKRPRQLPDSVPFRRRTFQHIDVVVPNLRTTFFRWLIWKVGSTRDNQRTIANARERTGQPGGIWKRRKTRPLCRLHGRNGRDTTNRQQQFRHRAFLIAGTSRSNAAAPIGKSSPSEEGKTSPERQNQPLFGLV